MIPTGMFYFHTNPPGSPLQACRMRISVPPTLPGPISIQHYFTPRTIVDRLHIPDAPLASLRLSIPQLGRPVRALSFLPLKSVLVRHTFLGLVWTHALQDAHHQCSLRRGIYNYVIGLRVSYFIPYIPKFLHCKELPAKRSL